MAEKCPRPPLAPGGLFFVAGKNRAELRWAIVLSLAIHFVVLTGGLPLSGNWPSGQVAGAGYSLKAALRQAVPSAVPPPERPAPAMAVGRQAGATGGRGVSRRGEAAVAKAEHSAALPAGESQADASSESLSEYRLALARTAKRLRYQRSPARQPDAAGEVVLAIVVVPGQPLPVVMLKRSSGHPALDETALAIIGEAARARPLPAGLGNRRLWIDLPVHFGPADQDQSGSGGNSDS